MNASVAIVQRIVPHYRLSFFNGLQRELERNGIDLTLYYGQERAGTVPRGAVLDQPWANRLKNVYLTTGAGELVWQPCLSRLREFDLVVVEQANRLLINHLLQVNRRWFGGNRLAFWGHGRNLQARDRNSWREALKRRQAHSVDWWFAYTGITRDYLVENGFPVSKITTVNNTIDVSELQSALGACDEEALSRTRAEYGVGDGPVGLYCGGLYGEKRINFLLEACEKIKNVLPDFHLMVIGEGPESEKVAAAAATSDWIHYLGPLYGSARASIMKMADIMLMPGAVGLALIDSFVAEIPLITTDIGSHGPEMAYLESGVNGVVSDDSVHAYSSAVVRVLSSGELQTLQQGCRASAELYSLDRMIGNFSKGIQACLDI